MQNRPCYLQSCPQVEVNEVNVDNESIEGNNGNGGNEVNKVLVNNLVQLPPRIYGFSGPFADNLEVRNRSFSTSVISSLKLNRFSSSNESALYLCYHGKVVNTETNQRYFIFDGKFKTSLPRCLNPTHCIGPVKKVIL